MAKRTKNATIIPWWVWLIAGGGVAVAIVLAIVIVVVTGGGRDPAFEEIKKGMSEDEVLARLGKPYMYQPKASGVWTYPRMSLEEFHDDPSRRFETKDVIFIYFRDGKVDNTYRKTGAEFRQPRPPR